MRDNNTSYPQQDLYEAGVNTLLAVPLPSEEDTNFPVLLVFSDYPSHRIHLSDSCCSSPNVFSPSPASPPRRMDLCPKEDEQQCSCDEDSKRYHPSKKDTVLFFGPSTPVE